jgi:hypothetical protein
MGLSPRVRAPIGMPMPMLPPNAVLPRAGMPKARFAVHSIRDGAHEPAGLPAGAGPRHPPTRTMP